VSVDTAPSRTIDSDHDAVAPFAVDHILVTELPSTLGTIDAPERYSVSAVFSRRPLPQELGLLAGSEVADQLGAAGYERVSLSTADRRLIIGNTNLHELRHGLARVIGGILEEIGASVAQTRSAQERDAAELAERAAERAQGIVAEAAQVDFSPLHPRYT
jgi:hypothetical protein